MKVEPVVYENGDFSLQLISETDIEFGLLKSIFKYGYMEIGNGDSRGSRGNLGFYIKPIKKDIPKK
jgi:hypothetical protein